MTRALIFKFLFSLIRNNVERGTLTSVREGRENPFYKMLGSGLHPITGPKQSAFNTCGKQTAELSVINETEFSQVREH